MKKTQNDTLTETATLKKSLEILEKVIVQLFIYYSVMIIIGNG